MILYLEDNNSKNEKIAIEHIRKYLRQLDSALKSGKITIKEFGINDHMDEISNDEINRKYNPTGRRTLKIIYYDENVVLKVEEMYPIDLLKKRIEDYKKIIKGTKFTEGYRDFCKEQLPSLERKLKKIGE